MPNVTTYKTSLFDNNHLEWRGPLLWCVLSSLHAMNLDGGYFYVSPINVHIVLDQHPLMHHRPVWLAMLAIPIAIPLYTHSNSMADLMKCTRNRMRKT